MALYEQQVVPAIRSAPMASRPPSGAGWVGAAWQQVRLEEVCSGNCCECEVAGAATNRASARLVQQQKAGEIARIIASQMRTAAFTNSPPKQRSDVARLQSRRTVRPSKNARTYGAFFATGPSKSIRIKGGQVVPLTSGPILSSLLGPTPRTRALPTSSPGSRLSR